MTSYFNFKNYLLLLMRLLILFLSALVLLFVKDTKISKDEQEIKTAAIIQKEIVYAESNGSNPANDNTATQVKIGAPFPGEKSKVNLVEHITSVYNWAAGIGSSLATLIIILAGFKYATSSGNPEALQDAKESIVGALIGLAVIALTFLLLKTIGVSLK